MFPNHTFFVLLILFVSVHYLNAFKISRPSYQQNSLKMSFRDDLSQLKDKVVQREQKVKEIEEVSKRGNLISDVTERALGRLAMVSFSVMLANEIMSGQSFFQQFEAYGFVAIFMSLVSFILSPKY